MSVFDQGKRGKQERESLRKPHTYSRYGSW